MIQIDIDMPKRCGECPLCVDYDCIIHKRVTDEYYDALEEQYAHCPLTMPSAQSEKPFKLPKIYVADGYDTVAGEDGNVGFGVYVPDENQIYVAGDVKGEIRARALFHEVCHWVQAMCGRPFDEDEANEFSDIVYDALPSAQPEHKRGRWMLADIYESTHKAMLCNKCNAAYDMTIAGGMFNYCPHCGADMRGEQL